MGLGHDAGRPLRPVANPDYQTRQFVNAPVHNPVPQPPEEIEVTDPAHPLCGRRFRVLSISHQPHSPGFVLVAYRDSIQLRIPVPATSLWARHVSSSRTKLTKEAIHDLLALVKEDQACRSPRPSGQGSRKP